MATMGRGGREQRLKERRREGSVATMVRGGREQRLKERRREGSVATMGREDGNRD